MCQLYNFAFFDEASKREIRRAIIKGVSIPGHQIPFASREMPIGRGWGTGGLQITLALIGQGDVLKVIDEIEEKPDFIVLDPPREGIHPKALPKIVDLYRCEKMLYISCKPTSLARDLVEFAKYGYRVEKVCCVDMFPGTVHCETVCLLSKLQSKEHIEIEVKMDELDLTSAESKATYEEIKAYVLEHTGLKVSPLYIAQVKQKYGIIERENYNKPKSENAKQPQCPPEKENAIMEALKHFGMIL